jgi:hypothetical protein
MLHLLLLVVVVPAAVQPGEADGDLSSMLDVLLSLLQELAAATRPGARSPTQYGRYKASLQCLVQLGPRFVAAHLLTKELGQAGAGAVQAGQQQQQQVVAGVLLEGLLEVTSNSGNKEMRNAAEAAMAATAALVSCALLGESAGTCQATLMRLKHLVLLRLTVLWTQSMHVWRSLLLCMCLRASASFPLLILSFAV